MNINSFLLFLMNFSIGVSKEQGKAIEINGEQFICSSCRITQSSEKLILNKRKHSDILLVKNNDNISSDKSRKKSKLDQSNVIIKKTNERKLNQTI